MKRRDFIKLSLVSGVSILMPSYSYASKLDISKIDFSKRDYDAQTIIIYMYGGASQLAGNLTNIDEIKENSQSSYSAHFGDITKTKNNFWKEAGGEYLENLLNSGDMTIYRACYSAVREKEGNKAHGVCTEQNQKGTFDTNGAAGVVSNLANILNSNGVLDSNTFMPFVTMEGESNFYTDGDIPTPSYLRAVGVDENFDNPYERTRWTIRNWLYYTKEERKNKNYAKSDAEGGFDPALTKKMDELAQLNNKNGKIKDALSKRGELAKFIDRIKETKTPDLGNNNYDKNSNFAKKLEAAIKLLDKSSDTKVVTMGTGGLGGWDDHNNARDYVTRANALFSAINSAIAHLKAIGKIDKINIMLFAEFGRNVNLNSANGWDHGNLQNYYIFGGKGYFNHRGVVGETKLDVTGSLNRLWMKPKDGTEWIEPISIAATLYKIYGIDNPEVLTGGYGSVDII